MHKTEVPQQTEFGKQRQTNLINIRKSNRNEILSKRRNTNSILQTKIIPHQGASLELSQCIQSSLKRQYTMQDLPDLARKVQSTNILQAHEGMIGIRKLLSVEKMLPIQAVIDANVVPKMIKFMSQGQYPRLQMEATWALTNVATGTSAQCQSIIDKGGIPLFVKLLSSPHDDVIEQAVWAIGNIAGDMPFNRDLIIKAGGVTPLIHLATTSNNFTIVKQSAWALSNLCRGNPMPDMNQVQPSVPVFITLIKNPLVEQIELIIDMVWALSYLSDGNKSAYRRIVKEQGVERLVMFLKSPTLGLLVPAIRTVGNLCSGINGKYVGDTETMNQVMRYPVLDNLLFTLHHDKKGIRRQACWVLANISASTHPHTLLLVNHTPLILRLLQLLRGDAAQVRKQILLFLGNLTISGNPQQLLQFYRHYHIVQMLADMLQFEDVKTLICDLRTIYRVLGVGEKVQVNGRNVLKEEFDGYGAIDVLEGLQKHRSDEVYKEVMKIFTTYYTIIDPIK